jgi:hypothetical protein
MVSKTPGGGSAAHLPIVGNHVKASILTHTREVRMWCRLNMLQDHFSSKLRIGIAEENAIHRGLSQDQARDLDLYPIENVRNETHRGAHDHPQRFQVVHQTTTPAIGPIARKLGSATAERFIVSPVFSLSPHNLFNAIFLMLVSLILRDASRQHHIDHPFRRS